MKINLFYIPSNKGMVSEQVECTDLFAEFSLPFSTAVRDSQVNQATVHAPDVVTIIVPPAQHESDYAKRKTIFLGKGIYSAVINPPFGRVFVLVEGHLRALSAITVNDENDWSVKYSTGVLHEQKIGLRGFVRALVGSYLQRYLSGYGLNPWPGKNIDGIVQHPILPNPSIERYGQPQPDTFSKAAEPMAKPDSLLIAAKPHHI